MSSSCPPSRVRRVAVLSGIVAAVVASTLVVTAPVARAADAPPSAARAAEEWRNASAGTARVSTTGDRVTFAGSTYDHPLAVGRAGDVSGTASGFVEHYATALGAADPRELVARDVVPADDGGGTVRYDQRVGGLPVIGGDALVRVDGAGRVLATAGHVLPADRRPGTSRPVVDAATAARIAEGASGHAAGSVHASPPELSIYDPMIFDGTSKAAPSLVWRTEVRDDARTMDRLVLVDASTGTVALDVDQEAHSQNRTICGDGDCNPPARVEGAPATGNAEVDRAFEAAGDTYAFYSSKFGRDGIDGHGMASVLYVHGWEAGGSWFSGLDAAAFGEGWATDDVVGHELTHGVTQKSSRLAYVGEPGAINEAMSDIFGELIDLTNGHGTDSPPVRWLLGEEAPGGAIRNLANPPQFGQPDRMRSPLYSVPAVFDPHVGSGVANKAAYLLTDGGSFNGHAVGALGIDKTARLFYEANAHLLLSASNYRDLADALRQGCAQLLGTHGFTAGDCAQVDAVVAATEMTLGADDPTIGGTDAPVCPAGQFGHDVFADDMEDPLSHNWTYALSGVVPGWGNESGPSTSGRRSLQLNSSGLGTADATMSAPIAIPVGRPAFLRFRHAFSNYDENGGMVQYSTDGGTTWLSTSGRFTDHGYNRPSTPIFGQPMFGGNGGSFWTSRMDVSDLAGQNVRFRFRMTLGTPGFPAYSSVWIVDDVRLFSCDGTPTAPGAPRATAAVAGSAQAVVSWQPPIADGGSPVTGYTIIASPGGGTTNVGDVRSAVVGGLTNGMSYTFAVRAMNAVGSGLPSSPTDVAVPTAQGGSLFHPVTPARVLDSRIDLGTTGGAWTAGETRLVIVAGRAGVPSSGVSAVVLNVTAVQPDSASHLRLWPEGAPRPASSSLSWDFGHPTVANHVTVKLGSSGGVSVFNNAGKVGVLADVVGYYDDGSGGGDAYTAVSPHRVLDSRLTVAGAWHAGEERNVTVVGAAAGAGVPPDATAVVANVTAVAPTKASHLTVWPSGLPKPDSSNVNFVVGSTTPNLVTVPIGAAGQIRIRNNDGDVFVLVDVVGYFAPGPATGRYVPLAGSRLIDSRDGTGVVQRRWDYQETRNLRVAGVGGVPSAGASAVVLNVTALHGTYSSTHITCWPAGEGRPVASNLNLANLNTEANQVIVRVGDSGEITCQDWTGSSHLVIDVVGYVT